MVRKVYTALGSFALVAFGCATDVREVPKLQPDDLQPGNLPFDPNSILDVTTLTDAEYDNAVVQDFLAKTPYRRPSFLETYQSNGLRASDALVLAARKHRINPFVLIVRAQMAEGLIGMQTYPDPPRRVDFVFGCGCSGDRCLPELGGFDRQVDCFAGTLRRALDQIAEVGRTDNGWAPGQASRTLDGREVVPLDEGTAALYAIEPVVGEGARGNWLFWNLFQRYAESIRFGGGFF